MWNINLAVGFLGVLRASHRGSDDPQSMHSQYPFHPHERVPKYPWSKSLSSSSTSGLWESRLKLANRFGSKFREDTRRSRNKLYSRRGLGKQHDAVIRA